MAAQAQAGALSGARAWIFSDGKAGHEAQALGVADRLGVAAEIKRVAPGGLWKALAPWGPVAPAERFGAAGSRFAPPWPDIAFAVGRQTIPYIRRLKSAAGLATYTVVLLDPKIGAGQADLFWVPDHDRRRGPNVIHTLVPPHRFSPQRLAALRALPVPAIDSLPAPRVAVLIGGPNGDYRYGPDTVARLGRAITELAAGGASLLVTPSRRTPAEIATLLTAATDGRPHYVWDGTGDNPYPQFLARADAFMVTADSINMTAEPCATGRPVYVFTPEGGSPKFTRFHDALNACGATRPAPDPFRRLDAWTYRPLDSAAVIAAEIERRWMKRRQMLGPATRREERP